MPPTKSTPRRLAAALLMAVVVTLVVTVAPATAATTAAARVAPAASGRADLSFHGDTAGPAAGARARRASFAWTGRRILYTESIPAKWDWALNTAIAKWNATGGGIRFVRTTKAKKARLTIGYGNTGQAAGLATVGRSRHASVRLNAGYNAKDSLDARTRVQVLGIFTHELGHVLGFEHTTAKCSLMSPVLDVDACGVLPATLPGFYKCRTIDPALATRFVQVYGGRVRYPSAYCPLDAIPAAVGGVSFQGGATMLEGASDPVTVSWARPRGVPAGSRMEIRSWPGDDCRVVPSWAATAYAPVAAGVWRDPQASSGLTCYRVQLVNRYGAGRTAVSHLMEL